MGNTSTHTRVYTEFTAATPMDLFADHTNSLTFHYHSLDNPFTPQTLDTHTCYYQPPYNLLHSTWPQCSPHLPSIHGFWALVPTGFYWDVISHTPLHMCHVHKHINYLHHTKPTSAGSRFTSTLLFIPPTLQHCICHRLRTL